MRNIKDLTDTPTEFELEDTAADIQRKREGQNRGRRGREGKPGETPQSQLEESVAKEMRY